MIGLDNNLILGINYLGTNFKTTNYVLNRLEN